MSALTLSRLQFGLTTVYHFFFVPLTLGLSILVAIMETLYVRTGDEIYKRMTKFWGKLFLINFAMGVATGLVQEFQFGMNWSEYSRFVGDVFGPILAVEGLLAFFLESTFLGIWIFGWDRLSKGWHAATIWLVAIGSNLSALWILIANSFMQHPVGYAQAAEGGPARLTSFGALVTNSSIFYQFPHVFFAGITVAGFFVLGVSAYRLLKRGKDATAFRRSFSFALVFALVGSLAVGLMGHFQGQYVRQIQPMKAAASEAIWETEDPAALSLVAFIDEQWHRNTVDLRIPGLGSFLFYNRFSGRVQGINDLQAEYVAKYGEGNYIPPVTVLFWTFRIMVGVGMLLILLALIALYLVWRRRLDRAAWFLRLLPFAVVLPYLATTSGWILAEMGRQPWIVYGLLRTSDGRSVAVSQTEVWISLLAFVVTYGALLVVDAYLLARYARKDLS